MIEFKNGAIEWFLGTLYAMGFFGAMAGAVLGLTYLAVGFFWIFPATFGALFS